MRWVEHQIVAAGLDRLRLQLHDRFFAGLPRFGFPGIGVDVLVAHALRAGVGGAGLEVAARAVDRGHGEVGLAADQVWSMRAPSEVARNLCSLIHRIDESTKVTPLVSRAARLSFSRNWILSSSETSSGSFWNAPFHDVVIRVDRRERDALALEPGVRLGDVDGGLRDAPRFLDRQLRARRKAPRAVDEDAHAEAGALIAGDVLNLLFARRHRFGSQSVDADVGVQSAEAARGGQRGVGEVVADGVDGRGLRGFGLDDPRGDTCDT